MSMLVGSRPVYLYRVLAVVGIAVLTSLTTVRARADGTNVPAPTTATDTNSAAPAELTEQQKQTPIGAFLSNYAHLQVGGVILSPFTITEIKASPGTFELKDGGTDVRGFIELVFSTRYAWRNNFDTKLDDQDDDKDDKKDVYWSGPFGRDPYGVKKTFDGEVRGGFAFAGDSGSSPSMGGGDGFADASFGWNMIREWRPNKVCYTVNLEGFGGFVADSEYSLIHPTVGGGVAFVSGFPFRSDTNAPRAQVFGRVGYALVDMPAFDHASSTGGTNIVKSTDGGPKFGLENAVQLRFETRLPVTASTSKDGTKEYGYFSFGGTYYEVMQDGRDPWSMYFAYSVDVDQIFQGLGQVVAGVLPMAKNNTN